MPKPKVKILQFEVIHFPHPEGHSILIYGLGDDGILYELAGGKWAAYPIQEDFMRPAFKERKAG